MPLIEWYEQLRNIVLKNKEPASRTFRYMSRLIEQEFGQNSSGNSLAFFSPDNNKVTTEVVLMLAYCLHSELECSVLIVDALLQRSSNSLTERLGLTDAPGYAEILRDGFQDRFNLIKPTAVDDLDILPIGQIGTGDTITMDRDRLREFLAAAAGQYRHVLLHVGSVLGDTRNLLTVAQSDTVFLLAEENRTLMKSIDDCRRLLSRNSVADLRIVVASRNQ